MKRDARDAEFSNLIRERDKWTCQKCGKVYPEHSQGLHCAHIFSRRRKSVRWDPENAVSLCYRCHLFWAHDEPLEFAEWIRKRLGKQRYDALRRRANEVAK